MTKRKRKILWTGPALDDLRAIKEYVSNDRPEAARRLAEDLRKAVGRLADFPLSGRSVPEFPRTDLREMIVAPYRIVYAASNRDVVIVRVWHGRREIANR